MDTANPRLLPSLLVIGGGGLVLLGSFLPWVTATLPLVGTISKNGVDGGGDGLISLGLAAALVILGFAFLTAAPQISNPQPLAILTAAGAVVLAAYEYSNVSSRISDLPPIASNLASVGSGIYVVGAGGALAFVGSLMMRKIQTSRPDDSQPPLTPPTPG